LRLPALAAAGRGGAGDVEDGDGDGGANVDKRAARSTRCGSEGKVGAGAVARAGGVVRGRSSSMACEVGSPSSAVKEPPPPRAPAVEALAGASAAWISPPAAGSSCGGEAGRIGAAEASGTRERGEEDTGAEAEAGVGESGAIIYRGPALRREVVSLTGVPCARELLLLRSQFALARPGSVAPPPLGSRKEKIGEVGT
jgi:hypothetical protein